MQNIRSLVRPEETVNTTTEAPSAAETQREIQRAAWLNNDYTRYFLAGLQEESDNKITQAMNMASVDNTELQIRRLLTEAKSLRDTVKKAQNANSTDTK